LSVKLYHPIEKIDPPLCTRLKDVLGYQQVTPYLSLSRPLSIPI